ncbi:MAG TPA: hypothetical protein VEI02_12885, partial [Planctomycetota bacterium]|nr:hypothetical protein [Planctomycetota bacterium]
DAPADAAGRRALRDAARAWATEELDALRVARRDGEIDAFEADVALRRLLRDPAFAGLLDDDVARLDDAGERAAWTALRAAIAREIRPAPESRPGG